MNHKSSSNTTTHDPLQRFPLQASYDTVLIIERGNIEQKNVRRVSTLFNIEIQKTRDLQ